MITPEDITTLNTKFYYLSKGFGGALRLYSLIRQSSDSEMHAERILHIILSHPNPIYVISPWTRPFSLIPPPRIRWEYDYDLGISIEDSYHVYDINQRHIYSVSPDKHKGLWGRSPLDSLFVKQSYTGELFFLHLSTYNAGPLVLGLLINNISLKTFRSEAIGSPVRSPSEFTNPRQISLIEKASEPSYIVINNFVNLQTDPLSGYYYPIQVHHLESEPFTTITKEEVVENPRSKLLHFDVSDYRFAVTTSSKLTINLDSSGWLVISQLKEDGTRVYLDLSFISGLGADRILQENSGLWYVSFTSGIDHVSLRKRFSQVTRRPKDFSTRNSIRVTADLIY